MDVYMALVCRKNSSVQNRPVSISVSFSRAAYHLSSGIFFNTGRLEFHFLRLRLGLV